MIKKYIYYSSKNVLRRSSLEDDTPSKNLFLISARVLRVGPGRGGCAGARCTHVVCVSRAPPARAVPPYVQHVACHCRRRTQQVYTVYRIPVLCTTAAAVGSRQARDDGPWERTARPLHKPFCKYRVCLYCTHTHTYYCITLCAAAARGANVFSTAIYTLVTTSSYDTRAGVQ